MKLFPSLRLAGFPDGRWLAAGLLVVYYAVLFSDGMGEAMVQRWRKLGVYAYPVAYADLQSFPAALTTLEANGELYATTTADVLKRPYNYPRVWLLFMRFPGSAGGVDTVGCLMAAAAVAAMLAFWGRLTTGQGLLGGLLLCSPAFQLGVERGNTDLIILVIVTVALWFAATGNSGRLASGLFWVAAILKLFPILALAASFEGSWRAWLRRVWLSLALFAAYLLLTWSDLGPVLRNTGKGWVGWVQSYGTLTLASAAAQVLAFYGGDAAVVSRLAWAGRILGVAGVGWILLRGVIQLRRPVEAADTPATLRARLGFRVGAVIYIATFLVGSSFDYRQCFLLLTLPQLFAWLREGGRWPAVALVALLFSLGTNYLLAGWPGFFINEAASWILLFVLASLLAGSWRPASSTP